MLRYCWPQISFTSVSYTYMYMFINEKEMDVLTDGRTDSVSVAGKECSSSQLIYRFIRSLEPNSLYEYSQLSLSYRIPATYHF